jgi:hypothetical protein
MIVIAQWLVDIHVRRLMKEIVSGKISLRKK